MVRANFVNRRRVAIGLTPPRKGLAGDSAAARASLDAIEKARASRPGAATCATTIIWSMVADGIDTILEPLRLGVRQYPTDEHRVRWQLKPWVVEAALARMGKPQLTLSEQRQVWDNTATPHKVRWPDWWAHKG